MIKEEDVENTSDADSDISDDPMMVECYSIEESQSLRNQLDDLKNWKIAKEAEIAEVRKIKIINFFIKTYFYSEIF